MNNHPEHIDPPWFETLIRRALDRRIRKNHESGMDPEEAWQDAMWYIFELRNNLTDLYQAGAPGDF